MYTIAWIVDKQILYDWIMRSNCRSCLSRMLRCSNAAHERVCHTNIALLEILSTDSWNKQTAKLKIYKYKLHDGAYVYEPYELSR